MKHSVKFNLLFIAILFPVVAFGQADVIEDNFSLARAMIADIALSVVDAVPTDSVSVVICPESNHEANDLFLEQLNLVLSEAGNIVFLNESLSVAADDDTAYNPPVGDYNIKFKIKEVGLEYPAEGRKFGLWRQWVDRHLSVTIHARVIDHASGRVLFDQLCTNNHLDRVDADEFDEIRSSIYSFTDAQIDESGMRRVLEEVVVVGSLGAMIAAYFANTGSQ